MILNYQVFGFARFIINPYFSEYMYITLLVKTDKDLIVKPADKGWAIVIRSKDSYLKEAQTLKHTVSTKHRTNKPTLHYLLTPHT